MNTWPADGDYPRNDWPPIDEERFIDWHGELVDCQLAINACHRDVNKYSALAQICNPWIRMRWLNIWIKTSMT